MKSGHFPLLAALLILFTAQFAGAAEFVAEKSIELPSASFNRAEHFATMTALQSRLSRSAVELAYAAPLDVRVSPERIRAVRQQATGAQKLRVGVVTELAIPVTFARDRVRSGRATLHDTVGALHGTDDGGFEWTAVIRSPEAAAVRVGFSGFDLPDGSELYVFTDGGMAFGPYTGRGPNGDGEFWTNTVAGSEIVMELHAGRAGAPRFTISAFGHLTDAFAIAGALAPRPEAAQPNCSVNANCVVGANCVATNSAVNTAKDAVAHILFASGGWLYICSGGLVADSDTGTNIPYFVTANHCISRASEASSLETFFFYEAACGSCPDPGAAATTGSTIASTSKTSDYTLLRLSQNAPSGAAFLGWSSAEIAFTNNAPLYRISHPKGAPQSYSEQVVDTSKGVCRSWPRGNWIYSRDTLGATEGGSSGSPVVNGSGQLVGQLSGACGTNVNDVCDSAKNATVDGAFAAYYPGIAAILGPGGDGGCIDADGDGVCASEGDCNDNDASIYPGANDTKGKRGRDGIDNDCDGTPDA
ncbi:MAG: trypsin-like peptidase domain-containing protein [Acidobacteria bacterium]|nr:trypsin-like peptidase domain-containing protein [Acidobacteriota bacterium]